MQWFRSRIRELQPVGGCCFSKWSFLLEHSQLVHLHTVYGCFLTAAVTTGTIWLSSQKYLLSDILRNNLLISGLDLDRHNQNCVELNQVDCKVSFNSLMIRNIVPEFILVAFLSGHTVKKGFRMGPIIFILVV